MMAPRIERFHGFRPPELHKPEAFYSSSWPVGRPVQKGTLTCDFWRHQAEEEIFEFKVLLPKDGAIRGAVECMVHAGNLTRPEQAKIMVERKIESICIVDLARSLVDNCD